MPRILQQEMLRDDTDAHRDHHNEGMEVFCQRLHQHPPVLRHAFVCHEVIQL